MSASEHRNETTFAQEAADWYARLRSDNVSEVEEARFRAWISGDPARRREFDALSDLWDRLEGVAQSPEVLNELRAIEKATAPPPRRVSRRAAAGWALAAGLACAVGFISWQRMASSETYTTGVGEQRSVPLSDGSVVTLNTSSELQVSFTGGQRRIDLVRGQANFEVAKDPTRPFIVSAGGGEVLALGTVFDVYQRPQDVVVTLIEGRVAVVPEVPEGQSGAAIGLVAAPNAAADTMQAGLRPIVLSAGEQVSYGAPGRAAQRSAADLDQVSAWRSRKLDFREMPLAEAIAEANRYSRIRIELRAPQHADSKFSGLFDAGRNEALAEGLRAYFGLELQRPGDDLIVLTQKTR